MFAKSATKRHTLHSQLVSWKNRIAPAILITRSCKFPSPPQNHGPAEGQNALVPFTVAGSRVHLSAVLDCPVPLFSCRKLCWVCGWVSRYALFSVSYLQATAVTHPHPVFSAHWEAMVSASLFSLLVLALRGDRFVTGGFSIVVLGQSALLPFNLLIRGVNPAEPGQTFLVRLSPSC